MKSKKVSDPFKIDFQPLSKSEQYNPAIGWRKAPKSAQFHHLKPNFRRRED